MTTHRDNHDFNVNAPEPLPAEFDAELAQVDSLLSHALHDEAPAPIGLSQRVFEMSVASLPAASESQRATQQPLRLVAASTVRVTRYTFATWRSLALAASVLLVAGVALWVTWPRGGNADRFTLNNDNPDPASSGNTKPVARSVKLDFPDLNRLAEKPSDLDALEGEVSYLLDVAPLRSFDDLDNDVRLLVQQLEM